MKRVLSIILSLMLVFSCVVGVSVGAGTSIFEVEDEQGLLSAFNNVIDGDIVSLKADITGMESIVLDKEGEYVLDLHGNNLEVKKLSVASGVSLLVMDSMPAAEIQNSMKVLEGVLLNEGILTLAGGKMILSGVADVEEEENTIAGSPAVVLKSGVKSAGIEVSGGSLEVISTAVGIPAVLGEKNDVPAEPEPEITGKAAETPVSYIVVSGGMLTVSSEETAKDIDQVEQMTITGGSVLGSGVDGALKTELVPVNAFGDVLILSVVKGIAGQTLEATVAGTQQYTYNMPFNENKDCYAYLPEGGFTASVPVLEAIGDVKLQQGMSLQIQVKASGNPIPVVSVSGLPQGISFDAEKKIISIAAAVDPGTYSITVSADNGMDIAKKTFEITVAVPQKTTVTTTTPTSKVATPTSSTWTSTSRTTRKTTSTTSKNTKTGDVGAYTAMAVMLIVSSGAIWMLRRKKDAE